MKFSYFLVSIIFCLGFILSTKNNNQNTFQNSKISYKNDCSKLFEKNLSSEEVIFNLNYIDINLDQRKWVKNFINILTTDYIQEVSKKWFRGKIKIHSNFGTCSTDAKIKVSGRGLDHINSNKMVSSLDVRLTKETIGHIKNFKLFLSGTRGSKEIKISERDDLEILLSAILRKLGVLSPITRKIEFSLNGNNVQGIFQEKPAKEFLESLNRREGPILFYDSDNEELTPKFASDSKMRPDLGLIKIANKNWAKRTKSNLNQAIYAYGVGSKEILSQFLRFNTGGPIQTDDSNEVNNVNFAIHEIVSSITMSWHSLYFYNRRFYWDSINETLEPIYYDGSPITLIDITKFENQSNNDFLQKYVTARFSKNILNTAIKKINQINLKDLKNYVKKMGFESDENYIDNYIKSLISISNSYYVFQDNQLKKNEKFLLLDLEREKKKFINKSRKFWPAENLNILYIDYKKDNNTYKVCSNISNCRFENYDLEDIVKFLSSSKVSNKKIQYSFVNYARNDYSDRVKLKKKNFTVIYDPKVNFIYDQINKVINLKGVANDSKVIFLNSKLNDYKINVYGANFFNDENNSVQNNDRSDKFGLTGCVTIIDSKINNLDINIENMNCEDSINLIRSEGTIKFLKVNNSKSDAVDFDFSNIAIEKAKINRSGNDCFDFSGGQYVITNATLINCKDKAVSVGEKSKAYLSNIYVNHTKFGIVSKDKSITNVEDATLKNCDIAFSAYRKKQEFGGGILQYSKVNNYCSKLKENDRLSEILSRN